MLSIIAAIFALLIAIIHIYVFALESLMWSKPSTRRAFGLNTEQSEANRLMAFNQGFYNLFLAIAIIVGLLAQVLGFQTAGITLTAYGAASVLGAGLVLYFSNPKLIRAAAIQIVPAALYLAILFISR